jgi:hypothetical protein
MPCVGFEPTILASERAKAVHALGCAATVTGLLTHLGGLVYEGGTVNRSRMDIKRKTCDVQTWEKQLLFDICSINIHTLVPSLYQYVENCSTEVF